MKENKPQTEYQGFLARLGNNPIVHVFFSFVSVLALYYIISKALPKSKEPDILTKLESPDYSISEFMAFKGEANLDKVVKSYIKEKIDSNIPLEKIVDKGCGCDGDDYVFWMSKGKGVYKSRIPGYCAGSKKLPVSLEKKITYNGSVFEVGILKFDNDFCVIRYISPTNEKLENK